MADSASGGNGSQPTRPAFTQAFGFAIDEKTIVPSMQATIDTAQQVANTLQATVNKTMVDQLAGSAVATDQLKHTIGQFIAAPVITAQQATAQLQQPIVSSIVNQLGSSIEATIPLGVDLPAEGGPAVCPTCVVIRSAANTGDLSPALQCFRAAALPFYQVDGMKYSQAFDWIQRCVGGASTAIGQQFGNAAYQIAQAEYFGAGSQATAAQLAVTETPATATGAAIVPAPAAPAVQPALQQQQQTIQSQLQLQQLQNTVAPLQQFGMTSGPAQVPPSVTRTLPMATPLHNWPPTCGALTKMTRDSMIGKYGPPNTPIVTGTDLVGQYGWSYDFSPSAPGCETQVVVSFFGSTFSGLQSMYCPITPGSNAPCAAPVSAPETSAAPVPTPSPGAPSTPGPATPQPTCQPVKVTVECGKTCKPESKPPEAPRQCNYQLVCSSDRILYIIPYEDSPRSQFDRVLATGDPASWDLTGAVRSCLIVPEQATFQPGAGASIISVPPVGCGEFSNTPGIQIPGGLAALSTLVGLRDQNGNLNIPDFPRDPTGILTGLATLIVGTLALPFDNLGPLVQALAGNAACMTQNNMATIFAEGLLQLADTYLRIPLDGLTIPMDQQRHFNCPTALPSASQAATAWLGNDIDDATLECWVRADNYRFPEFARVIDASRTKLSPGEYAFLARRKWIDLPTYRRKTRECGVTRDDDAAGLYELTHQIPPPTDIIRMMVRDTADNVNIDWSKEDAQFPQKYNGQLRTWGEQQGIDDEYMRMLWRAHFGIPAPGQLSEMLHRLARLPQGDPARVDLAEIRNALIQQDISPKWVDRFIAISYRPLTRIDARRAFEIGALKADGLREAYFNLGYDAATADTLVKFNVLNVQRTFLRRSEIKQLAKGVLSDADYEAAMTMFGADDAIIQQGRAYAAILRRTETHSACLKAYHKRFIQGETDATTAIGQIQSLGQTLDNATQIVEGWKCEIVSRGKNFSFGQLNQLYEDGLIDEVGYVQRGVRLGWAQEDAVLMLRNIQRRLGIKADTRLQQDLKRQQAAQEKLARQQKQLIKQAQADARRQANATARMQRLKELREKRLLEAAVHFSEHAGIPVPDSIVQIRAIFNAAMNQYPVTYDEAISSLVVITSDKGVATISALEQDLATALTSLAMSGQSPTLTGAPIPAIR